MSNHDKTINFKAKQLGSSANYNQSEGKLMTKQNYEKRIDDLENYIEELYNIIEARGIEYAKVMAYLKDKGLREDYEGRLKVIERHWKKCKEEN
ncbi:hypothetical protein OCA26_17785 [Bacillus cereus]|uniref:hypothetical protein n=1 Tax=Bacillus cereus TaxID=1396 RepID=UPI000E57AA31|nr:hypothetical protein [Bacillus cereus]MCU4757962.1 hypothetical protein [Bacillus cereus]RHW10388.1 hypothetical protein B7P27_04325 [Bacillus cereus]